MAFLYDDLARRNLTPLQRLCNPNDVGAVKVLEKRNVCEPPFPKLEFLWCQTVVGWFTARRPMDASLMVLLAVGLWVRGLKS